MTKIDRPRWATANTLRTRLMLWTAGATATVLGAEISDGAGLVVLAVAAAGILLLSADQLPVRLLTAAALLPAVLPGTDAAWALPLAGLLLAVLPTPATEIAVATAGGLRDLQRHLDRARRREEHVHLLVARTDIPSVDPGSVLDAFRTSDTVALRSLGDSTEVVALMDDHKLSRDGVVARLSADLGDGLWLGWAEFPSDGYNLETLTEHARDAITPASVLPVAGQVRTETVTQDVRLA